MAGSQSAEEHSPLIGSGLGIHSEKCETPDDPTDLLPVSLEYGKVKVLNRHTTCAVSGNSDRRPFVEVSVKGPAGFWDTLVALVDSGASGHSYMPRAVAERLRLKLVPSMVQADSATGGTMGPAFETMFEARFGGLRTQIRCLVVENLAEELILGMEFWNQHAKALYFKDSCVILRSGERIQCFTNRDKHRTFVRSNVNVVIAGHNVESISVRIPLPSGDSKIETWEIKNPSREPLRLSLNQRIAAVSWDAEDSLRQATLDSIDALSFEHVLDSSIVQRIKAVLKKHWKVFRAQAGRARSVQHVIRIEPGSRFPPAKLRRRSEAEREAEESMVRKLLHSGVLEPCSGPYASANVLVRKPTGAWRLTTDFRNLNAITVKDRYPIPLVDECLGWAQGFLYFSVLDLTDGFFQIPLHEDSRDLTAMITPLGLFRYCVIAQGMSNSPATFQRLMDSVLGNVRFQNALIYIDDLILGSKTVDEHLRILDDVLGRFEVENLTFSLSKCGFLRKSVEFLGHEVESGKIRPKQRNVEVIRSWAVPRNPSELQAFLGVVGWFRQFVPGFEKVAAPLRDSLRGLAMSAKKVSKRQVITCADWDSRFGDEQRKAFEALKESLCSPSVVLYLPEPGLPWVLDTDASMIGIGAALYQEKDSLYRPVCFLSRALTPAEKNYSVTELECLAVVWAVRKCRHYVYGECIRVRSDHEPLKWLLNMKEPRGRLARWALALSDYDFKMEYVKGASNKIPDALSRLGNHQRHAESEQRMALERVARVVNSVSESPVRARELPSKEELLDSYEKDEMISRELINLMSENPVYSEPEYYKDEEGILWAATKPPRRVIPDALVGRVLGHYHSSGVGGHLGVQKTIGRIAQGLWWWPGWTADVVEYLRACRFCARRKGVRNPQSVIGRRRPTRRFQLVAMDLLTISPRTPRGFEKVLVVADLFSRFTVAIPVADETAKTVAQGFLDAWIAPFGPPESLLTDNGPAFRAEFLGRLTQLLGIQKIFTLAHNPKANGVVERYNRTLCGLLAGIMADHESLIGWDIFLPLAVHAYNASRHASLGGMTPFELMFGRNPNEFSQSILPETELQEEQSDGIQEFVKQLRGRVKLMHAIALAASDSSHSKSLARSKAQVEKVPLKNRLKVGDSVMLWRGQGTLKGRKLELPWVGPYELMALDGSRATIRSPTEEFFVHVDRLKQVDSSVELSDDFSADSDSRSSVLTEISSLQKRRVVDGVVQFLVAWYGARRSDWTWESAEDLPESLVREFEESRNAREGVVQTRGGRTFR